MKNGSSIVLVPTNRHCKRATEHLSNFCPKSGGYGICATSNGSFTRDPPNNHLKPKEAVATWSDSLASYVILDHNPQQSRTRKYPARFCDAVGIMNCLGSRIAELAKRWRQGTAISESLVHGKTMKSALLSSWALHGLGGSESATPWGVDRVIAELARRWRQGTVISESPWSMGRQ